MKRSAPKPSLFLALLLVGSTPAFATYSCVGPVTGLSINQAGNVLAESVAGVSWGYLCSLTTEQNNYDPETCKVVYTALLAAQLSGQNVELWFNDSLTCSTHTEYSWLTGTTGCTSDANEPNVTSIYLET